MIPTYQKSIKLFCKMYQDAPQTIPKCFALKRRFLCTVILQNKPRCSTNCIKIFHQYSKRDFFAKVSCKMFQDTISILKKEIPLTPMADNIRCYLTKLFQPTSDFSGYSITINSRIPIRRLRCKEESKIQ